MFEKVAKEFKTPDGYPARTRKLLILSAARDGELYRDLKHEFSDERTNSGEYIPLSQRKPSVRYALLKLVVEDSLAFLFGEGRAPLIECEDRPTQDELNKLAVDARLAEVMEAAAFEGSVGSVAVLFRVLSNRVFLEVKPTALLTPVWRPLEPDMLESLTERRNVLGDALAAMGYPIADEDAGTKFWWQVTWTDAEETWFQPWKQSEPRAFVPKRDDARSVVHGLGLVPAVWIRNLTGSSTGDANDGGCTFRAAVETSVEIDYHLSQAGRGLKYSAEPTLLIKEPAGGDGDIVRSGGTALIVDKDGDAKLLEISGGAAAAVVEYVKTLREFSLESVHGNRASADKMSAAESGRAMELLNAPLINLADRLRTSYGGAMLRICKMMVAAQRRYELRTVDQTVGPMAADKRFTLRWPPYFLMTPADKQLEANTLTVLRQGGMISQETSVARIGEAWDINNTTTELAAIKADEDAADARAARQAAQISDRQPLPA